MNRERRCKRRGQRGWQEPRKQMRSYTGIDIIFSWPKKKKWSPLWQLCREFLVVKQEQIYWDQLWGRVFHRWELRIKCMLAHSFGHAIIHKGFHISNVLWYVTSYLWEFEWNLVDFSIKCSHFVCFFGPLSMQVISQSSIYKARYVERSQRSL